MTEHLPYIPLTLANPRVSGYNHTACEVGSLRGRKAAAPLKPFHFRQAPDSANVSAAERPRPH